MYKELLKQLCGLIIDLQRWRIISTWDVILHIFKLIIQCKSPKVRRRLQLDRETIAQMLSVVVEQPRYRCESEADEAQNTISPAKTQLVV